MREPRRLTNLWASTASYEDDLARDNVFSATLAEVTCRRHQLSSTEAVQSIAWGYNWATLLMGI
jgi:hypothetical protein